MAKGNVTALTLSSSVAAAADGVHIAGVPGVWRPGEAVLPSALGLTLAEAREKIKSLGLPLEEVSVPENAAFETLGSPDRPDHLESAQVAAGLGGLAPEDVAYADGDLLDRTEEAADAAAAQPEGVGS